MSEPVQSELMRFRLGSGIHCSNGVLRRAVDAIFQEVAGIKPIGQRAGTNEASSIYHDTEQPSLLVVSWTAPATATRAGGNRNSRYLFVDDCVAAKEKVRRIYARHGLPCRIIDRKSVDARTPRGEVFLIVCFGAPTFITWPKEPSPELMASLDPFQPFEPPMD